MKTVLKQCVLAAVASLLATGCTTFEAPAAGPEALAKATPAAGPAGYVALTLALDVGTFTGLPTMVLDVRDVGTAAVHHLRVSAEELAALAKGGTQVPLVFALPAGHYEVTGSMLHLPGGRVKLREYADSDQQLGLEHSLQPFAIEPRRLLHLAVVKIGLKETLVNYTLVFNTTTLVQMTRPQPAAWEPYRTSLAEMHATYLKKSQIGTFLTPPFTLGAAAGLLPDSEIKQVTHARQADVEACYLRNSPRAHGRVEARYVIAPTGVVHEATVTTSTLKEAATEACIIGVIKGLKFPAPPDDDFETWTAAWSF